MDFFDNLGASEKNTLTFNFAAGLLGVNILVAPTVTVTVYEGTDPNPSAILNGTPGLDSTKTLVLVPVAPTVPDTQYQIKVVCTTQFTNVVLEKTAVLPVVA
jgi:hypothetical protein